MSSTQQQLHRPDEYQNTGQYAPTDAAAAHRVDANDGPAAAQSRGLGGGTDVMGEPVNPTSSQTYDQGHAGYGMKYGGSYPTSVESHGYAPTNAGSHTTAGASATPYSTNGLPPSQSPGSSTAAAHQSANPNATQSTPTASPYVHTSSIPEGTGKTPMDSIMQVFNKWSKKAEDKTGNVWNHLKTGPNVADTALGRIAIGTKAMTEGGLENVFRQTFEVAPEEHLLKSFACYLSTSTGPVAGTLYLSTHKLAFCSDRPLAIPGSSPQAAKQTSPTRNKHQATTNASSSAQQQQQQQWCYYKVMVPISQLAAVNPTEKTQKKGPPERYVQVKTVDGHEFWFLGFVNYDKGVKNLQETLVGKNANISSNMNSTPSYNMNSPTATSVPSYNMNSPTSTTSTPSYNRNAMPSTTATTPSDNMNATTYPTSTPSDNMNATTYPSSTNAPYNNVN